MTDISIANVLSWKHSDQPGMETVENVITKFPGGIPTAEDQKKWSDEYSSYLTSTAYIAKRKADYKSLEEQADLRYWDEVNSTTLLADHIAKVKADHPKNL